VFSNRHGSTPRKQVEHGFAGPCREGVSLAALKLQTGEIQKTHRAGGDNLLKLAGRRAFDETIHQVLAA